MHRLFALLREKPKQVALVAGVAVFLGMAIFGDLQVERISSLKSAPPPRAATYTAALAMLMAVWWLSEAVPLAVTALLPLVVLPVMGVMKSDAVARQYFNDTICIFLGGFLVALAMERWNLHKRIALRTLLFFGVQPRRILLGFMVATAFLSMWISNTAAAMMMVTIALALVVKLEDSAGQEAVAPLAVALLLAVAYAASIGGIATLVGTPTNLAFQRIYAIQFPDAPLISFAAWFAAAFPISVAMLVATWSWLCFWYVPRSGGLAIERDMLRRQYEELGRISFAERVVLVDFIVLVVLWMTRSDLALGGVTLPGWGRLLGDAGQLLSDGTVAIAAGVVLFLLPERPGSQAKVMDWSTATKLPWDIVLLFGGGFALAEAFTASGLSAWIGQKLTGLEGLPTLLILSLVCLVMTFLTELTSNTATANMVLPILATLALAMRLNPLLLMVPATISCSFAFMMPVGTPPNAIVFGTGRMRMADMAKTGLVLNFLGVLVVVLGMYTLGWLVLGIELGQLPDWAAKQTLSK